MAFMPPLTPAQFLLWVRTEFSNSYDISYKASEERLASFMDLAIPSDRRTEFHGYYETAPYPSRVDEGQAPPIRTMKGRSFSVTNFNWKLRLQWAINDRKDEQTKSLLPMIQTGGEHYATLKERLCFQLLTGTPDPNLLAIIPNAPDGVPPFSATDGDGFNRFGLVGGNTFANGGVSSGPLIRNDFAKMVSLARRMQDPQGQPLWPDSTFGAGWVIAFNPKNILAFWEAFVQKITAQGATTMPSNAGVSNVLTDAGNNVILWPNQRIATDSWYGVMRGAKKQPFFWQEREGMYETWALEDTSDWARDQDAEYIQFKSRGTAACGPAYGILAAT